MQRFGALGLMVLLWAVPAWSELRRVSEVRLAGAGGVEWVDAHRYLRTKNEWERGKNRLTGVTFVIADVRDAKEVRLRFDLDGFQRRHPALFTGIPNVDLVHFDGVNALLEFDRMEDLKTTRFYSVWNVQTRIVSEPKPLSESVYKRVGKQRQATRISYLVGPDPGASRLYFADAAYAEDRQLDDGPVSIRYYRVNFPSLDVDWELNVELVRRERQLPAEIYRVFSPDGSKLALAEYYDTAAMRVLKADPPPQVYVIDFEQRKVSRYPIPRTPYGLAFSPDGRYLAVGSHEEETIVRIDLKKETIDRRVKTQPEVMSFVAAPSGESFLVKFGSRTGPKSIEVRRWSDLSLAGTLAHATVDRAAGFEDVGLQSTPDGKLLVATFLDREARSEGNNAALVTLELDEEKPAQSVDPISLVSAHVRAQQLRLYSYQMNQVGNAEGFFAPAIVANARGEAFVIGTKSELREDGPYEDGKSHPWVAWVDAKGKVVWQKSLRRKDFLEYQGASAVATPDGAVIAYIIAHKSRGAGGTTRLVKLDRKGKTLWEWTGPIGRETRFAESLQLLPNGRVLMKGNVGSGRARWEGELDTKTGKLVRDEVGEAAAR